MEDDVKYKRTMDPDYVLREAAWNILHENPGCVYEQWRQKLMEQFPAEVADALGVNPEEVYKRLSNIWSFSEFEDTDTGECHTIRVWSEYFATERSVELYDSLSEARRDIKRFAPWKFPR